jgi:hypothetical protein
VIKPPLLCDIFTSPSRSWALSLAAIFMNYVCPTAAGHERTAKELAHAMRPFNSAACKGGVKTAVADLGKQSH